MTKQKKYKKFKYAANKSKVNLVNKEPGTGRLINLFNIRIFRFLIVGTINTGFSYSVYALLLFVDIDYKLANLGALIIGIFFSFITQSRFVFYNTNSKLFFRFLLCWILIYFFNIYIIGKLISFGFNAYEAGAIALIPVTLFSYFLQKMFVFRNKSNPPDNSIPLSQPISPGSFMNTHLSIVIPC